HNAAGWQCQWSEAVQVRSRIGIDVTAACGQQHGPGLHAEAQDSANPYSWRCITNRADKGGVDLEAHCQQQGPDGHAVLVGSDAGGWRCEITTGTTDQTTRTPIDVTTACSDQYGPGFTSFTDNPADPYSWRCRRDSPID